MPVFEDLSDIEPDPIPGHLDLTSEGGEFTDIRSEEPITDWAPIFRRFNLDPQKVARFAGSLRKLPANEG